jgi:glycosyltransferase involved in cell wall biosynthesis
MANILCAYRYSPYTTANYLVKALRALGHEVRCFGPGQPEAVGDCWHCDAVIWVEAGGGRPQWRGPFILPIKRKAAWFLDSHSQHSWHREFAQHFNHVFVAQRAYVDRFDRPATWLPVACDPDIHTPPEGIEPEHDVVFCGHTYPGSPLYERRRRLLAMLAEHYDLGVYKGAYLQDMAIAHAKGRVVFNVSTSDDLNMRVFEALCSGRPLVTDWVPEAGIPELFGEPPPMDFYQANLEALKVIDEVLASPPEALDFWGARGRAAVLARHTYRHRAQQMLEVMGL